MLKLNICFSFFLGSIWSHLVQKWKKKYLDWLNLNWIIHFFRHGLRFTRPLAYPGWRRVAPRQRIAQGAINEMPLHIILHYIQSFALLTFSFVPFCHKNRKSIPIHLYMFIVKQNKQEGALKSGNKIFFQPWPLHPIWLICM